MIATKFVSENISAEKRACATPFYFWALQSALWTRSDRRKSSSSVISMSRKNCHSRSKKKLNYRSQRLEEEEPGSASQARGRHRAVDAVRLCEVVG